MLGLFKVACWNRVVQGLAIVVVVSLLVVGCGGSGSDITPVEDLKGLLARMPADPVGLIVLPGPGDTLNDISAWADSHGEADEVQALIRETFVDLGSEIPPEEKLNFSQLLEAYGVDGDRPFGIVFESLAQDAWVYVPVRSAEAFTQSPIAEGSDELSLQVGGKSVPAGVVGSGYWFVAEGYAVLTKDEGHLEAAAASFGAPHELLTPFEALQNEASNDLVQYWNCDALASDEDLEQQATVQLLASWYEGFLVSTTLGEVNSKSAAKVVAFKRAVAPAAGDPIGLRHPTTPETVLNMSLQDGAGLIELVMAIAKDGSPASALGADQLQGMLTPILGNSLALSVNMGAAGMPEVKLAVKPMQAEMLDMLLGMGGMRTVSRGDYDGVQLYGPEGIPPMLGGITYGFKDDTLVAASTADGTKAILDALKYKGAPVDDAPNRADVTIDLAKVASSPLMQMAAGMAGTAGEGGSAVQALQDAPAITIQAWDRAEFSELRVEFANTAFGLVSAQSLLGGMGAAKSEAQKSSSQNNQKQLGLVFKMYANESWDEQYPPLLESPGHLMFAAAEAEDYRSGRATAVYPEYLVDTSVLVNPGGEGAELWQDMAVNAPLSAVDDYHYIYLGYLVRNDEEMASYTQGYLASAAAGGVPNSDMEVDGGTVYRLREKVARMVIEDSSNPAADYQFQSRVPILMERRGAWSDDVINVLFMDGHVETVAPGQFPNTDAFWENVARINALKKE